MPGQDTSREVTSTLPAGPRPAQADVSGRERVHITSLGSNGRPVDASSPELNERWRSSAKRTAASASRPKRKRAPPLVLTQSITATAVSIASVPSEPSDAGRGSVYDLLHAAMR